MKKIKYMPYNFDFKFQYRTYKNIGKAHRIQFYIRTNRFYKIKKWFNKEERKYKEFDTYTQWRNYVEKEFGCFNITNRDNFIHYLQEQKEFYEFWRNIFEVVVTPIYVCLITLAITVFSEVDRMFVIMFTSVLIMLIVSILIFQCNFNKSKYMFYRDFIEILNT